MVSGENPEQGYGPQNLYYFNAAPAAIGEGRPSLRKPVYSVEDDPTNPPKVYSTPTGLCLNTAHLQKQDLETP